MLEVGRMVVDSASKVDGRIVVWVVAKVLSYVSG